MTKAKVTNFLIITLIILSIISCSSKLENLTKTTKNDGSGTFTNQYFKLSVKLPDGWYSQPMEDIDKLAEEGVDIIAGGDGNLKEVLDSQREKTINLFGFFVQAPGSPITSNPSVHGVAEDINLFPGIVKGADYLFHAKKLLLNSSLNYLIEEEFGNETINGVEFSVMYISAAIGNQVITQNYYASIYKGYAISFIETYYNPEEVKLTSLVFDSIQLDWDIED